MTKLLSAIALATAVLTAVAPSPAAQESSLALAMIRPDGILIPFAVLDGKSWTAAWPEPQRELVLEGMIENLPSWWRKQQRQVPAVWHVVRPNQPALKVNVLERVVLGEHCGNVAGLLTDMRPRRAVDSMPLARMLATDRPMAVEAPGRMAAGGTQGGTARSAERGESRRVTRRPMGTFKAGGSTFRVVLLIGYEGEAISVMQVAPGAEREVLRTVIGGC